MIYSFMYSFILYLSIYSFIYFHKQVRDQLAGEAPWDAFIPSEDVADHLDCVNPWPLDLKDPLT